jgi:hypothetical protein
LPDLKTFVSKMCWPPLIGVLATLPEKTYLAE